MPSWVDAALVVVPAWHDIDHRRPTCCASTSIPGAAFGLGDHPTTVLTLRLLRRTWWPGATVLDVGCGSGVLSVVAARLGAPYVEAIDISPAAVEATVANAERNGVAGAISVSTRPLAAIDEPFDLVLANLLAPVLVDLAPELRRVVAPSGALIVSGVLDGVARPRPRGAGADAGRRAVTGRAGRRCSRATEARRASQTARARTPIGAIRR